MLKNQGFIYLTRTQLTTAPLIKVNFLPGQSLPTGFEQNHSALAVWPLACEHKYVHKILDQLHAGLIRAGLAFTLPKIYQTNLTQMVTFIDNWLEVERHTEGISGEENFDHDILPSHTKYIEESTMNMLQLGHSWLSHEPAYEQAAASALYRGMIHGQENCQFELARCYEEGVGVEIDYARARELLSTLKQNETFPILLRLSYRQRKLHLIPQVRDEFFTRAPLPLPGKGEVNSSFHQTLLDMMWVSYEQIGHLDFWLGCFELVTPYKEEILALCEVRVMDSLDTPEASQTRHFHDILVQTFNVYRQAA